MKKAYIKQIETYLPEKIESNLEIGDERFVEKLGIKSRHIATLEESAGDLGFKAAEKIFKREKIKKTEIDFILMCTQHGDYQMPNTACHLQERLGLSQKIGALDYNLGCSGYVYGLSLAKSLIETELARNILLITSSVYTKYINKKDKSIRPLFGDGATATVIGEKETEEAGIYGFVFGTDGSKYDKLYIPVGGSRKMPRENPEEEEKDEKGNVHTNYEVHMDGMAITYFTFKTVPEMVEGILEKTGLTREKIDYYIFHQANKFMMEHVKKKCGIVGENFYNEIEEIGNTVSGTIPFGIEKVMKKEKVVGMKKVMIAGYGVGLSWAGCIVNLEELRNE